MRFSPLDQINTKNVQNLKPAWTYHLKPAEAATTPKVPSGTPNYRSRPRSSEATPIVVDGTMYLPTPYGTVVALDPETGKELWTFKLDKGRPSTRGVGYWPGDKETPAAIIFGTTDGRMMSLNAKTGKLSSGFGENGVVDLKPGIGNGLPEVRYGVSSPPTIYKNIVILGAQLQESPELGPAGDIRAWDAHDGKLLWQFHTVPHPGEMGNDTWPEGSWKNRSGANVWGLTSFDAKRGLIFLPIGSATYDYYGGDRTGKNLFSNSLVAIHAETGKLAWYFQAVHHDITDYDLESAPLLMDVTHKGEKIPAVAIMSKTGLMFILDRRDGKPIYGVEERPVPPSEIEGEHRWPTEPFPVKPQPLARNSFDPSELATVTPEQEKFCKTMMATEDGLVGSGPFSAFGKKLTVLFPGTIGASSWPGMSYDPQLGYLFVNISNLADVGRIKNFGPGADPPYQRTSPWGIYNRFWNEEKYWPCQKPPWGELWAINANTGEVAWKIPFGTIPELDAAGVHNTGSLNYGGSIATAGGLLFIGATNDRFFHAYDAATGKLLWQQKLDAGSYVVPITYKGKSGKQYVLTLATGGSFYDRKSGDAVIAFALP
ncbi:MAG: pyrroloquinoline quinone-dependent dehydrogenase [Edaphobacter sp.]